MLDGHQAALAVQRQAIRADANAIGSRAGEDPGAEDRHRAARAPFHDLVEIAEREIAAASYPHRPLGAPKIAGQFLDPGAGSYEPVERSVEGRRSPVLGGAGVRVCATTAAEAVASVAAMTR